MVYKKYIKRGGKIFGPYYCTSYRDKDGKVRTRFVSGPTKKDRIVGKSRKFANKKMLLIFGIILAIVVLFLLVSGFNLSGKIIYILYQNLGAEISGEQAESSEIQAGISNEGQETIGDNVGEASQGSEIEESSGSVQPDSENQVSPEIPLQASDSPAFSGVLQAENKSEETVRTPETQINESKINETISANITSSETNISSPSNITNVTLPVANETQANKTQLNVSIPSETNLTEIETINITNVTIPETNLTNISIVNASMLNETLNISFGLIKDIPDIPFDKNGNYSLNLDDYFINAMNYSAIVSENFSIEINNGFALIKALFNFSGTGSGKIIAYLDNLSSESNLFNIIVSEGNISIKTFKNAKLGKPVKWVKKIKLDKPDEISIQIPKEAENINVTKIETQVSSEGIEEEKIPAKSFVTGQVSLSVNIKKESFIKKLFRKIAEIGLWQNIKSLITGKVTEEIENEENTDEINENAGEIEEVKELLIQDNATEYEIEYETPAPYAIEDRKGKNKEIKIESDISYTDILAYTFVEESPADRVKVLKNGNEIESEKVDNNNDGLIDEVRWIANTGESALVEVEKPEEQGIIARDAFADIYDIGNGMRQAVISSGQENILVNGSYVPITSALDVYASYDSVLHISFGNSSLELKPYYILDDTKYHLENISDENILHHTHVYDNKRLYKYAFGMFNFSLIGDVSKIGFEVLGSSEIIISGNSINSGAISIDFSDIAENYNLSFTTNNIEVSGNFSDDLWLDPIVTLEALNITEDGDIVNISESFTRNSTRGYLRVGTNLSSPMKIYRTYVEFNTSLIPNDATIQKVNLSFAVYSNIGSEGCDATEIEARVGSQSDADLYSDIGNGTVYANDNNFCSTGGSGKVDISNGNATLQNQLSSDWFAVGVKVDESGEGYSSAYGEFYATSGGDTVYSPELIVTYTISYTNINNCTAINSSGEYRLTGNIINSPFVICMNISANNVTLDCQGYMIDGNITNDYGVYVDRESSTNTNVTIKNCTITDWDSSAVYLRNATNNKLENLNISYNNILGTSYGILFSSSSNNIINNTLAENNTIGVYFYYSSNNTLDNSSLNRNGEGVRIAYDSGNKVINSRIINNLNYGISIYFNTANNLIYNNLFNNTANSYFGSEAQNSWNTTNQSGTRIYSLGTQIGGNFWAAPSGAGYSQTCADSNRDGFCDSPFNVTTNTSCSGSSCGNNTDWLALSDEYSLDATAPLITVISPINGRNYSVTTLDFNVSLNENGSWCGFVLDTDPANTTMTKFNNTYFNSTKTNLQEGSHNLTFSCNDTSGNFNGTSISFGVDTTPPGVVIVSPENITYDIGNNIWINVTFSGNDISNKIVYNGTRNISYTNAFLINYTNGSWNVIAFANDTTGNSNTSSVWFSVITSGGFVDSTPPNINITSPLNITYSVSSLTFNISANENLSFCKVSLNNWLTNYSMTINATGTGANYTNTSVADGNYVARFWCNDTSNNVNNTENVNFSVDVTAPVVNLIFPVNNTVNTSINLIGFYYNVSDLSPIANCSLIIDNQVYSNATLPAKDTTNLLEMNLLNGTYLWNINCTDNLGNQARSQTRRINVSVTWNNNYIYTIAGTGFNPNVYGFDRDNILATGSRISPSNIWADSDGFYISDNNRIRFIPKTTGTYYSQSMTANYIYTIAGNGTSGSYLGDNILANQTPLDTPEVFVDSEGVYISDCENYRLNFVPKTTGTYFSQSMTANYIYTIAGNGTSSYSNDNILANQTGITCIYKVSVDSTGVYIPEDTSRIRFIPKTTGAYFNQSMTANYIYTIAGNGTGGYSNDNVLANQTRIWSPTGVYSDSDGVYIADNQNFRIRFVPKTTGNYYGQSMTANYIYTIAGNGTLGYNSDNVLANQTTLNSPKTIYSDSDGLYIADQNNNRIRFIPKTTGTYFSQSMTANYIYTIAGNGSEGIIGFPIDSVLANQTTTRSPTGVYSDSDGVYISDTFRARFVKKTDANSPKISINSPLAITYNVSSLNFNISSNENLSFCSVSLNNWVKNYTMTINTTGTGANYTNTSIADGSYTARFWCNDSFGNINNTENVNFAIDRKLELNFTSPTPSNGTITTNTSVQINISIIEQNLNELKFNWNGTNYSLYDGNVIFKFNFNNLSSLGENSTYAVDLGRYSNNVSCNANCPDIVNNGKYGKAYQFSSNNNNFSIESSPIMNNNPVYTITGWFNMTSAGTTVSSGGGGISIYPIITKGRAEVENLAKDVAYFIGVTSGNKLAADFEADPGSGNYPATGITSINTGAWYHFAVLKNSTGLFIYLNGNFEASNTSTTNPPTTSSIVKTGIGTAYDSTNVSSGVFNGLIDEITMFNRSLSVNEIYENYFSNLQKFNQTQWYLYVNQSKNSSAGLDSGTYTYFAYAKDNLGNDNMTETRQITINSDLTSPGIIIISPLNQSYALTSINFNISSNENLSFCSVSLNNWVKNYTMTINATGTGANYTNTSIGDGSYSSKFWCNDSSGNINNTEQVTFSIDTTLPALLIVYPLNISYNINVSQLNYTSNGAYCWYSNGTGIWNSTPVSCGTNWTNVVSIEGSNTWTLYANDSAGNLNSTSVTFFRDTILPALSIIYPLNISYSINVSNLNYTSNGVYCWYSNGTGAWNSTPVSCGTNFTNVVSIEGSNTWTLYSNDSAGNLNSSSVTFSRDIIYPRITITSPLNTTYSISSINFNISSNENLSFCSVSLNNWVKNYTMTLNASLTGANYTNTSIGDGSYSSKFWCNDTSGNINNTEQVTFAIDTTLPAVLIVYPLNISYNINVSNLNYTSNGAYCWYSNGTGIWNSTPVSCGTNWTNVVSIEGSNTWTLYANDSVGNLNSTNVTFSKDTIYPLIEFAGGTASDNSNFSRNWIYLNVSWTETNFANITFNLYNSSSSVNSTTFITAVYNINWTSLADEIYYYNVTIYDTSGNKNSTGTRIIRLDNTGPVVDIVYPINDSSFNFNNISINYTVSDSLLALSSCWYTNNSGVNNYSITCGTNFTQNLSEGSYTYRVYANDSLNNIGSDLVVFTVSTTAPSITLNAPVNNKWLDYGTNIYFNFTATDSNGLSTCELWGNWSSWHNNYTWIAPTNASMNYTILNLSGGVYKWNIWCNDSLNNGQFYSTNFTLNIDTTKPLIDYSGGTASDNSNFSRNWIYLNVSWTEANFANITFTLKTDSGIINSTIFTTATYNINWTSLSDNNYTYFVNITDKANNKNSTSIRTIILDTISSSLSIIYPLNISYNINVSQLNYTSNGAYCWYSNGTGVWNSTPVACGTNFTNVISIEGSNTWTLYSNDSVGNLNSTNVTFSKDTILPALLIVYPQNITYNINVSQLNYTSSGAYCWYSNGTGIWNSTPVSCGTNFTNVVSIEGSNTWTLYANDSSGNLNSSSVSFSRDIIYPLIEYGTQTETNAAFINRNNIIVNVSSSDTNLKNITIYLYNSTNQINSTNSSSSPLFVNFTGLADGIYYFNATAYDNFGNDNSTGTRNVTIDTILPAVSIVYPANITYNINVSQLNYTSGGVYCWYSNGTGIWNSTPVTCGTNFTNVISIEGSNTWTLYANDSAGNLNSTSVSFSKDTILPALSIIYPLNISYNINVSNLNYTSSGVYCWYSNGTGAWNSTPVSCGTNFTNAISIEGSNTLTLYANDSAGNLNLTTVTFSKDTIYPLINFAGGTENNNSNFSRNWIYLNVSWTETNFANITFNLYNSSSSVNSTTFITATYNINWTSLADEIYYYNATIYDASGNKNSTGTRIIRLDDTEPVVNIIYPIEETSFNFNNISINYTVSDNLIGIDSCWYSNNSGINNYSINCLQNFTQNLSNGAYTYIVYANDSLNNIGSDLVVFTVSTTAPAITLNSPENNKWFRNGTNIYFNFTVIDSDGLSTCELWANWTGVWHKNQTWLRPLSDIMNYTIKNLSEGVYKWNIWCNDSINTGQFYTNNFTLGIDSTRPVISIAYPINTSYNIAVSSLNYTFSELNPSSCWYSTNNGTANSTNVTCGTNFTGISVAQGNNTWRAYINDSAGNENTSSVVFFVDSISPSIGLIPIGNISSQTIEFKYNVSDNATIVNCSLIIDNSLAAYDTNVSNNGTNESIIYTTPVGSHTYLISCIDNYGNTANSSSGNIIVLSTTTSTTTTTSTGGGGTATKTLSMKIEVPSPISVYEKGEVEIPISISNDGQTDFSNIKLTSYVLKDKALSNIKPVFDIDNFDSLKSGKSENVLLKMNLNSEELAVYQVIINASSEKPAYYSSEIVYLSFVGKNASGVKKVVAFADDMIVENPECLELKEMVEDAKKEFAKNNFKEALSKANSAIEACRKSISGPKQVVYPALKGGINMLLYLAIGVTAAIALGILFNIYKRIKFRKRVRKRDKIIEKKEELENLQ